MDLGQKIGDGPGLCAPVHASVSGTVQAVEARPHPNGTTVLSVVIANDFQETVSPEVSPRADLSGLSAGNLMDIIREAGSVGMGGATFPTHVKLSSGIGKVDTIIVNASECEPYITADERLLREQPDRVLRGLEVLMEILDQKQAVIGMEDNKPAAAAAVEAALLRHPGIRLQLLKARYPQGAEIQLIQARTGRQVPPGGLPASVGCAVFNINTTIAIYHAIKDGMPVVRKVVTVSGSGVVEPKNLECPIGTPVSLLFDACGGLKDETFKLIAGGPMMGMAMFDLNVPITKTSSSILAMTKDEVAANEPTNCIRCGRCASVCPSHLVPQKMAEAADRQDLDLFQKLNGMECYECGTCTYVCPAKRRLTQSFKQARRAVMDQSRKK